MDKVLLCRLCLSNSENLNFLPSSSEIEIILQKYNIQFEVISTYVQHYCYAALANLFFCFKNLRNVIYAVAKL